MSLAARIASLETAQNKILRCPQCQYTLSNVEQTYGVKSSVDTIEVRCHYCGTTRRQSLAGLDPRERELTILTCRAQPKDFYQNERIYAASQWLNLRPSALKTEADEARLASMEPELEESRLDRQSALEIRKRIELRKRAIEFTRQRQLGEAKAIGPCTFSLFQTLREIDSSWPSFRLYSAEVSKELKAEYEWKSAMNAAKKREACEVVLWGVPSPETLAEIKRLEAQRPPFTQRESPDMRKEVERHLLKIMEAEGWDQETAARKLAEALGKRTDLASIVSQYAY